MKERIKIPALTIVILFTSISCSKEQKEITGEYELLVEKYVEYWNTGKFDHIDDVLSKRFDLRMTPQFEPDSGIDRFMSNVEYWRTAYPDFHLKLDEVIYSDRAATIRWTITATNTGPGNHPPTGKNVKVPGISIIHFSDGKIKDEWIASNNYLWLQQLGFTLVTPSIE